MQWDYWYGPDTEDRRVKYAAQFRPEYQANGDDLVRRIDAVVTAFTAATQITLPYGYASGWRPKAINDATANAGKHSAHLTAQAGDKRDTQDGQFAWWCMANTWALEQHGLYMEHPVATVIRAYKAAHKRGGQPTPWCHLSTRPPASHMRVFWPDSSAPAEWQEFLSRGGQVGATYADWLGLYAQSSTAKAKGAAEG